MEFVISDDHFMAVNYSTKLLQIQEYSFDNLNESEKMNF